MMSPRHPVTIEDLDVRLEVGIPAEAASFAFVYPIHAVERKLTRLYLNDTEEEHWAYLFQLGGFCYFDGAGVPVATNALTPFQTANSIHLDGPYTADLDAIRAMRLRKRLMPVTVDALLSSGLISFGWVHPDEQPGGHALGEKRARHGAFLYDSNRADPVYYRLMTVPRPEPWPAASGDAATCMDPLPGQ